MLRVEKSEAMAINLIQNRWTWTRGQYPTPPPIFNKPFYPSGRSSLATSLTQSWLAHFKGFLKITGVTKLRHA